MSARRGRGLKEGEAEARGSRNRSRSRDSSFTAGRRSRGSTDGRLLWCHLNCSEMKSLARQFTVAGNFGLLPLKPWGEQGRPCRRRRLWVRCMGAALICLSVRQGKHIRHEQELHSACDCADAASRLVRRCELSPSGPWFETSNSCGEELRRHLELRLRIRPVTTARAGLHR